MDIAIQIKHFCKNNDAILMMITNYKYSVLFFNVNK